MDFKSWPFGSLAKKIPLLTIFLTSPHTSTGQPCTGVSEDLRRIETRLAAKANTKQVINMNWQYYRYNLGRGVRAYPPTYGSIGSFLVHFVAEQQGSAKSVANILSNLRVMCLRSGTPWVSSSEAVQLGQLVRQLKLDDPTAIQRKDPLLICDIRKALLIFWKVKESMSDFLAALISLVGHDGLFRGDELFNNIKVKDIRWTHDGNRKFSMHIGRPSRPGKTATSGAGINQDIWDYAGPCAYKYLATWFDLNALWNKPEAYIFPRIERPSKDATARLFFTEPVSKKWYENQLAKMLEGIGRVSSEYSVHSLRAGGATDLFNAGTPIAQIQQYGRWTTLVALIYYRDRLGHVGYNCARAFGTGRYQGTYDY